VFRNLKCKRIKIKKCNENTSTEIMMNEMHGASVFLCNFPIFPQYGYMNNVIQLSTPILILPLPNDYTITTIFLSKVIPNDHGE